MAFGGVATGSIKAQEAETAITDATITGDKPKLLETATNTGISRAALAVLEASSVKNTTKVVITNKIINGLDVPNTSAK